jgi:hypothetical protein
MPPVGFAPTIAVLERAKTVRALDRAPTAIGIRKKCVYSQNSTKQTNKQTNRQKLSEQRELFIYFVHVKTGSIRGYRSGSKFN